MRKFEYKIVSIDAISEELLNDYGAYGWELTSTKIIKSVSVPLFPQKSQVVLVFKREVIN